jgi:hypothetical protein
MKTRKLITVIIAIVTLAITNLQAQVPSYVPTNGLVGYWGFNGNANDQSGNGNNGTVNGATLTTDRNGNTNSAYSFDGINDNINFNGINVNLNDNEINTVSFWMKWNGENSIPFCWIPDYSFYFQNGNVGINTYEGNTIGVNSNSFINEWKFVVIQFYNGVPNVNNSKLWVDGVIQSINGIATIFRKASNNFVIGSGYDNYYYFNGQIDDLSIYNRALTQAEITQLYTSTESIQNLCTKTIQPYNVNVGDASHDGSTYAWSISPEAPNAIINGNGTNTITIDWTNVPDGSYTLQAVETSIEGCVSTAVSATINLATPIAPVAQPQTFCTSSTIADLTATGTEIKWYASANDGTALSSSTALTNGIYYASQTVTGCESTRAAVNVSINDAQITASSETVCSGTAVAITATATSTGTSTLPANLQNGLVGYWPFNGNANDESGNGNNGTVNGATLTTDRFGNNNGAYSLNNLSDVISTTNISPSLNNYSKTISVWLKFPNQYHYSSLSVVKNGTAYSSGFDLAIDQNNSAYGDNNYLVVFLAGNGGAITFISNQSELGNWANLVAIYNGSEIKLYLNGNLKASQPFTGNLNCTDSNIYFGLWDNPSVPEVVSRQLDDIAIYNRALSPQEVTQLYTQGQTTYLWSTGETTATINPAPTETTTYWCDVTTNGVTCRKEMTITVAQTIPTFPEVAAVCSGATLDALPTISTNGVTGTWMPEINNLETTDYTFTPDEGQCATVVNQTIVVNPTTSDETIINAANSYTWDLNGETYTASGIYTFESDCQTNILNLTIESGSYNTITISACGSYTWNGVEYTQSGLYTGATVDFVTDLLDLTILPATQSEVTVAACGDSYLWDENGTEYTESGDYTISVDCNTAILHLTLTPKTESEIFVDACGVSYFWNANNTEYTVSGDYVYSVDCDTYNLHLFLIPESQSETTIDICGDSYIWEVNGTQYTESGNYINTLNCNTDILHLTLTPETQTEVTVEACGTTYTWDSTQTQYTESGDYTNSVNCNTETLHLTLIPETQSEFTVAVCGDSYLWDENGTQYFQSGDYSSTVNCHTSILHLTLTPATQTEVTVSACGDAYTWDTYGVQYTQSGDYSVEVNCHTDILHLTLTPRINNTTSIVACESYLWTVNGTTYTSSGNYTYEPECTIENLEVTIKSNAITTQPNSASICKAIGATASLSVVTAADVATYKWYMQAATGTTWTLVPNNANYSGATTATLNITKTTTVLPASGTKYKVEISSYCGVKNSEVVTITDLIIASKATAISVVGTLTPALTTCQGNSVNLALAAGSIGNIQWQSSTDGSNYTNVGDLVQQTAISAINPTIAFNTGTLSDTTWFRAVASNGVCNSVTSVAIKITVSQPASVGTFSHLSSTVCTGSGTSFSLSNAVGSIVWYKSTNYSGATPTWSLVAGATTATLNTGNLTYSAAVPMVWYKAIATNGACIDYSDVVSVSISAAAKATVVSVVGTLSPALTTCQGSNVNLALAAGSIGNLQWRSSIDGVNYDNVGSLITATSAANPIMTFNTGVLTQTTWFQAVLTNNSCTAISTPIKITVSEPANAGNIVGGDVTVCAYSASIMVLNGTTTALSNSTQLSLVGATGTIKWQKSLNYINTTGANPIWTTETSTSNQLTVTNLAVDTWYRAVVTNGACVAETTPVKIAVSKSAVAGSITATTNGVNTTSVCAGGDITFTSSAYVGSAIQWEVSTTSASTGFQAIAGANQLIFNMSGVTYAPSSTFYVRSVVTSGNCSMARSTVKTITVSPLSVAGIATGAATICSGSNGKVQVVGATGSIQWQSSADGINFVNVPTGLASAGTNYVSGSATAITATYLVNNITAETFFRAKITSGTCSSVYTNATLFSIAKAALPGIITSLNSTVCSGTGTTLTLTGALGTIQWQKATSLTGVYSNISGATASTLATGNITVATAYRAVVTIGSCSTVIASPVLVSVYSAPLAKTISANVTSPTGVSATTAICASTSKLLTIAAGSNGAIQWQHSTTSTTTGFTDLVGETGTTYLVTNPAIGVNYYRAKFTNTCGVTVNGVAFTVYYKNCATAKEVVATQVNVPFSVVAFPNPFLDSCNINLTTSSAEKVQVLIYDMIGKLIDKTEVAPSAVNDLQLGTNYPAGVYNVIVSQGENMKTLRIIKK